MCDSWIKEKSEKDKMITPFSRRQISLDENNNKIISYGLSSYGYDARLSEDFLSFNSNNKEVIDPKDFSHNNTSSLKQKSYVIPANGFVLAKTMEHFKIPKNILVLCVAKSTYARCGIIVNVTPIEPEWEGYVTLELSNSTKTPVKVYSNEGICQFLFFLGNEECSTSYKKRGGKYMNQVDITTPFV